MSVAAPPRPSSDAEPEPARGESRTGPPADSGGRDPGEPGVDWALPAVAAAAALAALAPVLYGLGARMWAQEHRQFFPFVLAGAAFLTWYKLRPAADPPASRPNRLAAAALWLAAGLAVAAAVAASGNWLGGVALLVLLPAWVYSLAGARGVRHLSGVWLFLLLALPLPFGGDGALVRKLQRLASDAAAGVLDLLGYVHVPRGVTLEVAGYDRPFFVDEACSGVNSLFSALCCVGFYLVWESRGLLRSALVLAATVGWVLVANAARVLAIVLGTVELGGADWAIGDPANGGVDLSLNAGGWGHELLGFAAFGAVLGLVVSTDRLLAFLVPQTESDLEGRRAEARYDDAPAADRRAGWAARLAPVGAPMWAAAAMGLALLGCVWFVRPPQVNIGQDIATDLGGLRPLSEDALPAAWDGWRRVKFEEVERQGGNREMLGEFSRIWWYAKGPLWAAVSVDGPYWQWHDLAYCYRGQGWDCEDVTDIRYAEAFAPTDDNGDGDRAGGGVTADASALPAEREDLPGLAAADAGGGFTEMSLRDDAGNSGLVLFAGYTDRHRGIDPAGQRIDLDRRLLNLRRIWDRLAGRRVTAETEVGRTYQVQLLHTNLVEPDEAAREALGELFHEMRRRLVARSAAGAGAAESDSDAAGAGGD